eukprot:8912722-Pyramimonas_sp.AAC.1
MPGKHVISSPGTRHSALKPSDIEARTGSLPLKVDQEGATSGLALFEHQLNDAGNNNNEGTI